MSDEQLSRAFIAAACVISSTALEEYHARLGLSLSSMREMRRSARSIVPEVERATEHLDSYHDKARVETAMLDDWRLSAFGLDSGESAFIHSLERLINAKPPVGQLCSDWIHAFADASQGSPTLGTELHTALEMTRKRFAHVPPIGLTGMFDPSPLPTIDAWDQSHQDPWELGAMSTTPDDLWEGNYPDVAMLLLLREFESRGFSLERLRRDLLAVRRVDYWDHLADWEELRTRLQLSI